MSRAIHSSTARMLGIIGVLGVATLAAPAASHGQTISPNRALLNTTAAVSHRATTIAADSSPRADGESALLGRSAVARSSQAEMAVGSFQETRPIDGEQALLNKVALTEARRLRLAM